jgi:UPF0042 nucleotide-binding protein
MSGAGRSTAARALEDSGFHVMDNLPPALISDALEKVSTRINKVAIVLDIRTGAISEMVTALAQARRDLGNISVLFLDADNADLVHRFEGSRRPHPLQTKSGLLEAIEQERLALVDVRSSADLVIDTSGISPHELRQKIEFAFGNEDEVKVTITVISFGFKWGTPIDADLVFDARFLPNPHWDTKLRPLDGRSAEVNDFVMEQPLSADYLKAIEQVVNLVATGYLNDGKRYLTVAIGCTGGKHRSVALAENLAARLVRASVETYVLHRDCERE